MKIWNKVLVISNIVLIGLVIYMLFIRHSGPRIAYIQSDKVIYGFLGTIEAQNKFKSEVSGYQANFDSLEIEFKRKTDQLNTSSGVEKANLESELNELAGKINDYQSRIEQILQEREMELTQSAINQINTFVTKFGHAQGYDLILGTGTGGNVLFGDEDFDITQEFLDALNNEYYAGVDITAIKNSD